MGTVWLIRHGESISNADLPTEHPATSALTDRGHQEAVSVARAFRQAPDLIVVSPFLRAQQTAVPTQERFPQVPVEEWPVHEFTYLHARRYQGTTGRERGPHAQSFWERNDPAEKEGGDGESFAELMARVTAFKTRLARHPAPFLAVFSHGLFLRAFIWRLLTGIETASPEAMRRYYYFARGVEMPNGAVCEVILAEQTPVSFTGFETAHLTDFRAGG